MLDDLTAEQDDLNLHSISHAVIRLEQLAPLYGAERRRLRVIKMRGTHFRGGYHDFVIRRGGVQVFPRLVAAEHHRDIRRAAVHAAASVELDTLLGGGLDRGHEHAAHRPLRVRQVHAGARLRHGRPAAWRTALMISFDETRHCCSSVRGASAWTSSRTSKPGLLRIEQIDPAEISPGELPAACGMRSRTAGARIVVIDSLTGYLNAMPEEQFCSCRCTSC